MLLLLLAKQCLDANEDLAHWCQCRRVKARGDAERWQATLQWQFFAVGNKGLAINDCAHSVWTSRLCP